MPRINIACGTPPCCFTSQLVSGAAYTDASPKPDTTIPAIIPVLAAGNHFTAGGVADA